MIFVDANIPMYLVGADHPNKAGARRLLETAVEDERRLVTSVEVVQEILASGRLPHLIIDTTSRSLPLTMPTSGSKSDAITGGSVGRTTMVCPSARANARAIISPVTGCVHPMSIVRFISESGRFNAEAA